MSPHDVLRRSDVLAALRMPREGCMCGEKNVHAIETMPGAPDVLAVPVALLSEVSDLLAQYIDEIGECDHSVNVCRCGVTRIADDVRVILGGAIRCAVCGEAKPPAALLGCVCDPCACSILAESAEEDTSTD